MAMPAIATFVKEAPPGSVWGIGKPSVRAVWEASSVSLPLIEIPATFTGTFRGAEVIRSHAFERCVILSNSWRSAFIPFSARVSSRRGARGHWRSLMLTEVVESADHAQHLSRDYADLLGVPAESLYEGPLIEVPEKTRHAARALLSRCGESVLTGPLFGLLPGAARGPSKRWPSEYFGELGRLLQTRLGASVVVLGAGNERALCQEIAEAIGGRAWSFAGSLSFLEGLAVMEACNALVSNDSGGMHMSWALGRPLVAIFGITDPEKTGPLGPRSRVLQDSTRRSRTVPRDCPEARAALARITPQQVCDAVELVMAAEPRG